MGVGQTNDMLNTVLMSEEMKRTIKLKGEKKAREKNNKEKELWRLNKELQNKNTLEALVKETFDLFKEVVPINLFLFLGR